MQVLSAVDVHKWFLGFPTRVWTMSKAMSMNCFSRIARQVASISNILRNSNDSRF